MSSDRYLTSITKLNGENYHDWKFAVSMALQQKGCWAIVSGTEAKPAMREAEKTWENKAEEGLTIIALTVDPSQYTYVRNSTNSVEAWKALKDIYEKNSRSTRISLKQQFYGFKHDTNAPMSAYVNGITDLARKHKGIGIELTDQEITDVLIFNLDNEYSIIAASLMAAKEELKVTEVTSTLIEEERRKGGSLNMDGATALLANSNHKYFATGPPGRRSPNRDRQKDITNYRQCYRCGRPGHILRNCIATTSADGKPITEKETSSIAYHINTSLNDINY